jgi:hypothetical protein
MREIRHTSKRFNVINSLNRAAWYRGNAPGIYPGGSWLESRTGQLLSGLRFFSFFPQSVQENGRMVPQLSHDHFLPKPFKFTIYLLSYHLTLFSLDSDSVTK